MEKEAYSRSMVLPFCFVVIMAMLISFVAKINTFEPVLNIRVGDAVSPEMFFPGFLTNSISYRLNTSADNNTGLQGKGTEIINNRAVFNCPGKKHLDFKLFGIIPLSSIVVNVVESVKVVPGGQSIGVMLNSKGVMVVGISPVTDRDGKRSNPAAEAGIMVGDVILSINGEPARSDEQVREQVSGCGKKELLMELKRSNKIIKVNLKPVFCRETGRYRIGLYVRDGAAGVGTISFYHPGTGYYGALGHVINDADTSQKIELADGRVVSASVKAINPGRRGRPGEKVGMFTGRSDIVGNIEKNTRYGIFGELRKPLANPFYKEPLPVAMGYQIKKGPAEIMTVLNEDRVEKFTVEIQEVLNHSPRDGKDLIIKITDQRLLERTGGIIQGMSGSPIIQNGMLVGAVTHVFINDPTRGYGVLAEWMLQEAGIFASNKTGDKGIRQKIA